MWNLGRDRILKLVVGFCVALACCDDCGDFFIMSRSSWLLVLQDLRGQSLMPSVNCFYLWKGLLFWVLFCGLENSSLEWMMNPWLVLARSSARNSYCVIVFLVGYGFWMCRCISFGEKDN